MSSNPAWVVPVITAIRERSGGADLRRGAPSYVIAGLVRLPGSVFTGWALGGTLRWAPLLLLLTPQLGDVFITRITPVVGSGWGAHTVAAAAMLSLVHGIRSSSSRSILIADPHTA